MKKVYILMVLLICFIFGQITYCAEPATLDGFLGLPWGASSQQIKNLMKTRPKTTLKSEDQKVIIYESTFAGEDAEIGFFIYQDKMWQAVILINFEEYEVIKSGKHFVKIFPRNMDSQVKNIIFLKALTMKETVTKNKPSDEVKGLRLLFGNLKNKMVLQAITYLAR